MAVTLAKLYSGTDKTYGMRLVAGKAGLENFVRWVHIVEDSEVPDFLHGNELVFTTGIGHRGNDWLKEFAEGLFKHSASGLVVNIGPYITSLPQKLVEFCNDNAFPLFTVPWSVKLIDITYDFCHRIMSSEESETSLAAAFRNLIFNPGNKDGYAPVLERRGFHDVSDYILIAAKITHKERFGTSADWKKQRYQVRKLCASPQYPSCIFVQENYLIVIRQHFSPTDAERLASQLVETIAASFSEPTEVFAGISGVGLGFNGIHSCYHEAMSAMRLAGMKKQPVMHYRDIGVYKLLFGVESSKILSDYVDTILGPLFEFDSKNNTNCAEVLKCYFENNCSVKEAADILGVHRNTVNYKLKQIRDLLNCDFSEEDKMKVLLAFHAKELLDDGGSKLIMEDDSYEEG